MLGNERSCAHSQKNTVNVVWLPSQMGFESMKEKLEMTISSLESEVAELEKDYKAE